MNNNDNEQIAKGIGYLIAKGLLAALMAYLITTYTLPFWVAFILIFVA